MRKNLSKPFVAVIAAFLLCFALCDLSAQAGHRHHRMHRNRMLNQTNGYTQAPSAYSSQPTSSFSGPAHIEPSQYHYFVQEYSWDK